MRFSVHVDAGYLYGALATRLTGSANRAAIKVTDRALVDELRRLAEQDCGGQSLRLLWYDAGRNGQPDPRQEAIGMLDGVKLRMGRVSPAGDQKGVDLRLGLDLVSMSNTQSVGIAYVVSGDDDLSEAVSDAQDRGLQIKLIGVPDATGAPLNVAKHLRLTADALLLLSAEAIDRIAARVVPTTPTTPPTPSPAPPSPAPVVPPKPARPSVIPPAVSVPVLPAQPSTPVAPQPVPAATTVYSTASDRLPQPESGDYFALDDEEIAEIAQATFRVWAGSAAPEEVATVNASRPVIPGNVDRLLLQDLVTRSGVYYIPDYARNILRQAFWDAVDRSARCARDGQRPSSR